MKRAALLAVVGLGLLGSPAAAQHGAHSGGTGADGGAGAAASVRIGLNAVSPPHVDIVTGESVMWKNDSGLLHTVTASAAGFDSGLITPAEEFDHRFTAAGEAPYHCTLHPLMQGTVGVHDLLLEVPPAAASPKRPFVLTGRASKAVPAGTALFLEADGGLGFAPVASTTVGADGRFQARVVPRATTRYRAVAGSLASPPVDLLVLDRRVSLNTQRVGHQTVLRVKVAPASPGGHVVLQLFRPDRFGWWPVQRARLNDASSARFTVRTRRHLQVRAILTLPDGATRLAVSRTAHVGQTTASARGTTVR